MSDFNLITTYTFHGHPYLVKMSILNGCLELILTNKQTGEEWECSYDVLYIENLTRKTGNFKQFDIFVTMLKSGLLKTSDCISLDLFTYEDLQSVRVQRMRSIGLFNDHHNRKYLIITYSVEFDRINYPLPLEYCGPPDPFILQATIKKLENELKKAKEQLISQNRSNDSETIKTLHKRIDELTLENKQLTEELHYLSKIVKTNPSNNIQIFQQAITQIEKNLVSERNSHHKLLEKLQNENAHLMKQLENVRISERNLRSKLQSLSQTSSIFAAQNESKYLSMTKLNEPTRNAIFQKKPSPSIKKVGQIYHRKPRSRSVSPLIQLSDTNRSRSRNGSTSTKQSNRALQLNLPITAAPSPRYIRTTSPCSDRSSTMSYKSEITSKCKHKTKMQSSRYSKSASPDVGLLQTRINNMFKKKHFKYLQYDK